ncbi:MAG: hypothetical protein ABIM99_03205 [Candidatus Dojkabacteria bacterium]
MENPSETRDRIVNEINAKNLLSPLDVPEITTLKISSVLKIINTNLYHELLSSDLIIKPNSFSFSKFIIKLRQMYRYREELTNYYNLDKDIEERLSQYGFTLSNYGKNKTTIINAIRVLLKAFSDEIKNTEEAFLLISKAVIESVMLYYKSVNEGYLERYSKFDELSLIYAEVLSITSVSNLDIKIVKSICVKESMHVVFFDDILEIQQKYNEELSSIERSYEKNSIVRIAIEILHILDTLKINLSFKEILDRVLDRWNRLKNEG